MSPRLPVVAVVGRPNVGKSTLFNRFIGERKAIVADTPGVTRDRNFEKADWAGTPFFVVDTGGLIEGSSEPLDKAVREQALYAAQEADLILLVVDGKAGIHPLDERIADLLRTREVPILVVVNKMDNLPDDQSHHDFWSLGLGEPVPLSALSGRGSGDLLDVVLERLPEPGEEEEDESLVRVAVIGKPNVGKSSFVNRLFGEERAVVSEVPGTTRDPVDSKMTYHGRTLVFVDTAGLRRQSRMKDSLEYYSSLRTARVVRATDVCVLLVDAYEGLNLQDVKVAESAWQTGCGLIIGVNKWDLMEKQTGTSAAFRRAAVARSPFLGNAPFLFISALTGQRVRKALDLILEVQEERIRRIDTSEVNRVLEGLVHRQPPPHARGRPVKLRYATQPAVAPPTFILFCNLPNDVPANYIRYLENGFRKAWTFAGAPIRIHLRKSSKA